MPSGFNMLGVKWDSFQIPSVASPGLTAGQMFAQGDILAIAPEAYATGDKGVAIIRADKVEVTKATHASTEAIVAGDILYWNSATGKVSKNATSGFKMCGTALEAAASTATSVIMDFNGTFPLAQ
jgi:predicted RecA/RadA family phage recombinase